jgi:HEAT repeat protein
MERRDTDPDGTVRYGAAWALQAIGPDARAAVPELAKALSDVNEDVRRHAASALPKKFPMV